MSGRFVEYFAQGEYGNRPAAADLVPLIAAGCAAIFYAYDTKVLSIWDGDTPDWVELDATYLTGFFKDLADVDWTTPPTNGQVMAWNNGASKFAPVTPIGAEEIRDFIAAALVEGAGIDIVYDDALDTITITCTISQYTNGMADARIAAASVTALADVGGGAPTNGQVLTWNNGASQYEPATPSAAYTDEQARDAIGAALVQGTAITITVNDGADTITIDVNQSALKPTEHIEVAMSDMSTNLTTGNSKAAWVVPYDFTLTEVITALTGAQSSSGAVATDIRVKGGSTIFSTPPSIDASEDTNLTGTVAVLSTTALTKGQILLFDISSAGTGAKGLVCAMIGHRT